MRTVTYRLADLEKKVSIHIGRLGENEVTRVQIDAGSLFAEYPAAVASMSVENPEGVTYPATVTRDGDMVIWDVRDSDLAKAGHGEIQWTFTENGAILKSAIARTSIGRSIVGEGTPPDPLEDWIEHAEDVLEQVDGAFPKGGSAGQVLAKKSGADYDTEWVNQGSGGTGDYEDLENLPQIGGVELKGDKSLSDLGAAAESDIPDVSGFYTKPSGGIPASDIADGVIPDVSGFYTKPSGGIPASDLADGVIPDVSGFYTKPSGGIPASDLADGVIPDPEDLIDDTAGAGDTEKVWSADKSSALLSAIDKLTPDATASDVGKAIIVKTVEDGKPTSYEYGEAGGGSVDPQDIAEAVADWCDQNITEDPTVVIDKSLSVEGAAADAKASGDVQNAVLNVQNVDLREETRTDDMRIKASDGSTSSSSNWRAYIIDVDKIDETFKAKLYSSSTSYACIAFYTSKTTFSSSTLVGTPIVPAESGTYITKSGSDLTIPTGAVCALMCTHTTGTESYITKTVKTSKVYTKAETDALVEKGIKWIELGGIAEDGVRVYGSVGSEYISTGSGDWRSSKFDVSGKESIKISTIIYGSTYAGYYFVTSGDVIVEIGLLKGANESETITDYEVTVPNTAKYVIVNKYTGTSGNSPTVKAIMTDDDLQTLTELRILSFNCGKFDYDDGTTTDAQYKTNWRNMLNGTKFDVCALQDYTSTFGQLQDESKDVLFGNTIKSFLGKEDSNEKGLRLASRINAGYLGRIDVGGGSGVWRSTVYKYNIFAMGINIVVYVGHYQSQTEYATARATQYANVIADAQAYGYEYVVFVGDFNSASISELAPFVNAGYVLCNGGYTGEHITLPEGETGWENIPVDNIIYSPNLMETHFEVLNDFTLNTDHYPIMATLKLKS